MTVWLNKLKEVATSVAPVIVLVLLMHFFRTPLPLAMLTKFLIGSGLLIAGLSVFLVGIDLSVSPFGDRLGSILAKSKKLQVVVISGLVLGFIISLAEPALHILADQINMITNGGIGRWPLVVIVSIGLAIMVSFGLVRVLYGIPLYKILTVLYIIIFVLSIFVTPEYLAIAFDSSGATTGAMAVPFLLSLSLGIAKMKRDGKSSEKDSFGLIAIASAGAITAVMIMSLFAGSISIPDDYQPDILVRGGLADSFISEILSESFNSLMSIAPLFILFLVSQIGFMALKRRNYIRMSKGFYYSWAGLVLFMAGVNAGFMDVGREIGSDLAGSGSKVMLIIIGFILGLVSILAEPAVHVLTQQIEDVTSGSIKRVSVLAALALGVGVAVSLSVVRIILPGFQLWHILLPGYIISLILAHTGSKLFVGIAFDSGGVASGPMTSTFILAYTQGAAGATQGANILIDGFGVIALVALTPIITLQVLGMIYRRKTLVRAGVNADV